MPLFKNTVINGALRLNGSSSGINYNDLDNLPDLSQYLKVADFNTTIGNYVTSSSLTTTLAAYAKKVDIMKTDDGVVKLNVSVPTSGTNNGKVVIDGKHAEVSGYSSNWSNSVVAGPTNVDQAITWPAVSATTLHFDTPGATNIMEQVHFADSTIDVSAHTPIKDVQINNMSLTSTWQLIRTVTPQSSQYQANHVTSTDGFGNLILKVGSLRSIEIQYYAKFDSSTNKISIRTRWSVKASGSIDVELRALSSVSNSTYNAVVYKNADITVSVPVITVNKYGHITSFSSSSVTLGGTISSGYNLVANNNTIVLRNLETPISNVGFSAENGIDISTGTDNNIIIKAPRLAIATVTEDADLPWGEVIIGGYSSEQGNDERTVRSSGMKIVKTASVSEIDDPTTTLNPWIVSDTSCFDDFVPSFKMVREKVDGINTDINRVESTLTTKIENVESIAAGNLTFKGTVGTGGTIGSLPAAAEALLGDMYKVVSAISTPVSAKVGDTVICAAKSGGGYEWIVIPSGDDIEDTWRPIYVNKSGDTDTPKLANSITTGALNIINGNNINATWNATNKTLQFDHATQSVSHTNNSTSAATVFISGVTTDTYGHITAYTTNKIPDFSDTWRKIKINGADSSSFTTATTSKALDLTAGTGMSISESNGVVTFNCDVVNTNTWRPVKYSGTTLNDATTTLEFIAGNGIGLGFSGGKLTITNSAPNVDTKVEQKQDTSASFFPVLAKFSANTTDETNSSKYNSGIRVQPSTGMLQAKKLNIGTTDASTTGSCTMQYNNTTGCLEFIFS